MRPRGAGVLLAAVTLLVPMAAATIATAQPTPRGLQERVSTALVVDLGPDLSRAHLEGVVSIHRVTVALGPYAPCGGPCEAKQLRAFYRSSPAPVQALIVGQVEHAAAERARAALSAMDRGQGLEGLQANVDLASLTLAPSPGSAQVPVAVHLEGNLSLPQLARANVTTEQARALFDAGARVQFPLSVPVPPGQDLALTVDTPDGLALRNGSQAPWRDAVTFWVDNTDGQGTRGVEERLVLGNPNATRPTGPRATAEAVLDLSRVEPAPQVWEGRVANVQARMGLTVELSAVAVPDTLPREVRLPALSAKGLRSLMATGLVDPTILDPYEEVARQQLETSMEASFGRDVQVHGGWIEPSLGPGAEGPLRLEVWGTTNLSIPRSTPALSSQQPTLTTVPLPQLRLPWVEPLDTHVRSLAIIVPPGTALVHGEVVNGTLGEVEGAERTYQLVDPTPRHSPATVHDPALAVGPGLFWSLYGGAVVVLAAAVGAVAAWIVYKRTIVD